MDFSIVSVVTSHNTLPPHAEAFFSNVAKVVMTNDCYLQMLFVLPSVMENSLSSGFPVKLLTYLTQMLFKQPRIKLKIKIILPLYIFNIAQALVSLIYQVDG